MEQESIVLKPPTSFEQQIEIYRSRGLIINDDKYAIHILKHYNYYRLRGYTLSLMKDDVFIKGTTFDHIYRLYEFDAKLRLLLMTIIEHIEISFRTHLAYLIAHKYGPLGYRNSDNFNNKDLFNEFVSNLDRILDESKELFVIHYKKKYDNNHPAWEAFEVLTFGMLSKLFKNLKNEDKKEIVYTYYSKIPYVNVESWLYAVSIIRNICAHYSRIYNKRLIIKPRMLKKDYKHDINNNELFSIIFNLKYLITNKLQWENWVMNLDRLIKEYNEVDIKLMGFPDN